MNVTDILGIDFANVSLPEAVEYAMQLIKQRESCLAIAPDSELVREFHRDRRLRNAISDAELVVPESYGVMLASRILGLPVSERISLIDFCSALLARMSEKEMSIFILGTDQDTVELACENITRRYPGIRLVGSEDGYYSNDEDIVDIINELKPDLVIVSKEKAIQERWMYRYRTSLNTGLLLGLGDDLKYYAGLVPRAPKRWRNSGFEWLYWIIKHPGRILKAANPVWIIFKAFGSRIFGS